MAIITDEMREQATANREEMEKLHKELFEFRDRNFPGSDLGDISIVEEALAWMTYALKYRRVGNEERASFCLTNVGIDALSVLEHEVFNTEEPIPLSIRPTMHYVGGQIGDLLRTMSADPQGETYPIHAVWVVDNIMLIVPDFPDRVRERIRQYERVRERTRQYESKPGVEEAAEEESDEALSGLSEVEDDGSAVV